MGFLDGLFAKKQHDPAKALIDWLECHPQICRRTVAQSCGAVHHYAGRVLTWIVTHTDCDKGTALNALWETLAFGAVEEMVASKDVPSIRKPQLSVVDLICRRWRAGLYGPGEFGFDCTDHSRRFSQKLRKFRCRIADFDLPEEVRSPLPGPRFSMRMPTNQQERSTLEDLIQDMWVCDRAVEDPEQWLPKRKQRLGY